MDVISKVYKNTSFLIFFILFQCAVSAQISKGIDFEELSEILQQNFGKKFEFSVRIENNDTLSYVQHFGHIDKNQLTPVNEETLFNIASISKSITAVGILKLVEQNEIRLSDELGTIFENVPKDKLAITIKTLLSHRSGLKQTYPVDGISEANEALNAILNEELEFTPESGFRYSNQNYQLLALIIEKVTQIKYEAYIRKNVLVPLMMDNTYFWDEVNGKQNIAALNGRISRIIGKRNWGFIGAAGIFSTTKDLSNLWNGIYKKGFLSEHSINTIFQSYYQTKSGLQIGLGFYQTPKTKWNTKELWTRGTESWGHNGVIRFFPDKDVTIIVVTNSGEIDHDSTKTGNRIISTLIADYLFE